MRQIAVFALLALSACGPAAAPPSSTPDAVPSSSSPQGNTSVIGAGDGFFVTGSGESRVVTHEVAAPVNRVWQVRPDVYRELGITASADARTRTVARPGASVGDGGRCGADCAGPCRTCAPRSAERRPAASGT